MQVDTTALGDLQSASSLYAALKQRIPGLAEIPESTYGIKKGWDRVRLFGYTRGTVLNVAFRSLPTPTLQLISPVRMAPPGEEPNRMSPWMVWGALPPRLTDNGGLDMIFDTLGTAKYFKVVPRAELHPSLDHPILAQSSHARLTGLIRSPRWLDFYRYFDSLRPSTLNALGLQHPYLCIGHGAKLWFVVPLDTSRTVGDAVKVAELFQPMCNEVESGMDAVPSSQLPLPIVSTNIGFGPNEYVLYRCPRCGQMEPTVSKTARTSLLGKDWVNSMTVKCRAPLFREG